MSKILEQQALVPLSDESLSKVISQEAAGGKTVLVVANGFTAVVATTTVGGTWAAEARGDFGLKCGAAAKVAVANGQLLWWDVTGSPATANLEQAASSPPSPEAIEAWLDDAEKLTSSAGRGAMPKAADLDY